MGICWNHISNAAILPRQTCSQVRTPLMKNLTSSVVTTLLVLSLTMAKASTALASISFAGSDYNIGGTFYPGGESPYVVVPWRSETAIKAFDIDRNNVYGSDGYALFGTEFNWPNIECCGTTQLFDSLVYPNLIELPSYIAGAQSLVANKTGGYNYALIDDPRLVNGYRDYNWGNSLSPPVDPLNSQSPYVKLGLLQGTDILGNNPRTGPIGAARWAFTLGSEIPDRIRVSVMTDGYDDAVWSATEVLLARVSNAGSVLEIVSTGAVNRDRFVDMHTFDILGATPGDNYAVFAKGVSPGNGGIAGVAFDSVPEPCSLAMLLVAGVFGLSTRRKR